MGQLTLVPMLPHCAIVYPLAVLKSSKNTDAAKEFAQY